jgi:hypothetical protein
MSAIGPKATPPCSSCEPPRKVEDVYAKSKGALSSPTSAAVDDRNLGSAPRTRSTEARVQPDSGDPMGDQPGVLQRRYRPILTATAVEEEFARAFIRGNDYNFRSPLAHGNPSLIAVLSMKLESLNERAASNLSSRHVCGRCLCGAVELEIDFPAFWAWHDHSAEAVARTAQRMRPISVVGASTPAWRRAEEASLASRTCIS